MLRKDRDMVGVAVNRTQAADAIDFRYQCDNVFFESIVWCSGILLGRMRDGSRGCSRRRGSLVRRSGASRHTYPSCPPLLAPPICLSKPKLFHRL
jgi:hypothetical protein